VRLLQALQAEGYAAQDPDTLTYRVTPKVASLSRALIGKNQTDSLIQVALDMLAEEVKWPAEYLVHFLYWRARPERPICMLRTEHGLARLSIQDRRAPS
jgi:hypothetical protein